MSSNAIKCSTLSASSSRCLKRFMYISSRTLAPRPLLTQIYWWRSDIRASRSHQMQSSWGIDTPRHDPPTPPSRDLRTLPRWPGAKYWPQGRGVPFPREPYCTTAASCTHTPWRDSRVRCLRTQHDAEQQCAWECRCAPQQRPVPARHEQSLRLHGSAPSHTMGLRSGPELPRAQCARRALDGLPHQEAMPRIESWCGQM